jgi:hypothetical protein
MKRLLQKTILEYTIFWANNWYVASVLDDGSDRYDLYWNKQKYAEENAVCEFVTLLMQVKHDELFTYKSYIEKIRDIKRKVLFQ